MKTAPILSNRINNFGSINQPSSNPFKKVEIHSNDNKIITANNNTLFDYKAYNYNVVSFKGNEQRLFLNFVQSGKPKIYEFLCNAKKTTPIQVLNFLDNVMADNDLSMKFVKEVTDNPRKSADIIINLTEKLGGIENFRNWYFKPGGYRENFGKYTGNHYSQANNVDDLLRSRPNWKLTDIIATYHKSQTGDVFKGSDPLIGTLPKEFGDKYVDFPHLINFLHPLGNQQSGDMYLANNKLICKVLKDADDKKVCKITSTQNNKDFIVKIDKVYADSIYSRLRANSIYLESMIGRYLSLNECKDVPNFHFYDFYHNAAVFDFSPGKDLINEFDPIKMNQLTPDLLSLGVRSNDIHISNYLQTDNGVINIDLGNATYFDPLKPGDLAHTIFLPNYTGLDFANSYSALDFAKFIKSSQKVK